MNHDVVVLGASHVTDDGVPLVQAVLPIGESVDDGEHFGEIDVMSGLGVSSLPWPADDKGHAEGVVLRNCGNRDGVIVGARDTRTAAIVGKMKPGDTVLHSTGPEQAAQVQCKESKRQVVAATKDSRGKTMLVLLDGTEDRIQITGAGHVFQMSRDDGISILDASGSSGILIKDGVVTIIGALIIGGPNANPALRVACGTVAGISAATPVLVPMPGVFIGS